MHTPDDGGQNGGHREPDPQDHGGAGEGAGDGAGGANSLQAAVNQAYHAALANQAAGRMMMGNGPAYGGMGPMFAASASHHAQSVATAQQQMMMQNAFTRTVTIPFLTDVIEPDPPEHEGIEVGEIIAWRAWRVEHGWLYSMVNDDCEWAPGETIKAHKLSHVLGDGVHAFKTRKQALDYAQLAFPAVAVGQVVLWGEVVEFEKGWHGEYASVHDIVWAGQSDIRHPSPMFDAGLLKRLRATYGLEPDAAVITETQESTAEPQTVRPGVGPRGAVALSFGTFALGWALGALLL